MNFAQQGVTQCRLWRLFSRGGPQRVKEKLHLNDT